MTWIGMEPQFRWLLVNTLPIWPIDRGTYLIHNLWDLGVHTFVFFNKNQLNYVNREIVYFRAENRN